MEILHRVGFNANSKPEFKTAIDKLKVKYSTSDLPGRPRELIFFDIAESDANWQEVTSLIETHGASDRYDTYFSDSEILDAEWLRLVPTYEHGYPQPENTWATNPTNYEILCQECGTYHQNQNFRVKKEPKLRNNNFMTFAWAYELFATNEVFETLKNNQISGYEVWDAIIHDTDLPAETIKQMYVPNIADPGLVRIDELKSEICNSCDVIKYYSHLRSIMYLRGDALDSDLDILRTYEWFGGGTKAAYREILISNRFARLIIENMWKGLRFKVIELVE